MPSSATARCGAEWQADGRLAVGALVAILGIASGFIIGFGSYFLALHYLLHVATYPALVAAIVLGFVAACLSAVAFAKNIYGLHIGVLGFVLDVSWSLLNFFVGIALWAPVCLICGSNFVDPDPLSQRSGTFVFDHNPRGGGYDATTIGTVIAGGWASHEEVHVWQARIFGPAYLPVYLTNLLLNLALGWVAFDFNDYAERAYRRIIFEDWAYAAGQFPGSDINWGFWFLWLLITSCYVGFIVLIVVGIILHNWILAVVGAALLLVYTLVRTWIP
jgi:hypothetical protein